MKTFMRWVGIGLFALLVGGGAWLWHGRSLRVKAEEQAVSAWKTRCVALDIVFVVDQSSSMKWNDPLKNRIYAVQVAMDWLVTNRLGMCPGVVHRVGIVSFGEQAEVDLPLTPLDVNSEEEWQQRKQQLLSNFGPKDLIATDQWAGMRKAKELLDSAPFLKGPYPRKRAIILLTDGWPCVSGLGCSAQHDTMDKEAYMRDFQQWASEELYFSPQLLERERALAALRARYASKQSGVPVNEVNQVLANHPVSEDEMWKSVYVWVIAMNDRTDYLKVVGDYLKAITESHGGALFDLQENRSEVPVEFDRVLSRLLNIQPERQQCGGLYVDPYLEALVINVYKNAEGVKVKIVNGSYALEGGKDAGKQSGALQHFAQKVIYSSNGEHNEHYTFILPRPGKWEISSSVCDSFQALVLPLDPLVMTQQENTQVFPLYRAQGQKRYDPDHPMYLHFPIFHNSKLVREYMGQNLPPLLDEKQCTWVEGGQEVSADCGLEMWAYIRDPMGNETKTRMKFVDGTQEWQTEDPVPVDAVGTYQVDVEAWTHCLGDQQDQRNKSYCEEGKYTVIPKGSLHLTYQVAKTVPLHLKVISPAQKIEAHDTLWPGKLHVLPLVVKVETVDVDGHQVPAKQVFGHQNAVQATVRIGEGEKGIALHLSQDGGVLEGSVEGWPVTGQGTVQVNLVGDYDYQHYQILEHTISAQFVRRDPLWRSPLTYKILAGLIALALAVFVARIIYMHTNPVYGRLIFEPNGGGQPVSVPLPRRRFSSPKRLPQQLGLDYLKARVAPGGKGLRVEFKERSKPGKRVVSLKETPPTSIGGYRVHWDSGGRNSRRSVRRTTPVRRPRPRRRR